MDTIELYGDVVYSRLDTKRRCDWFSVPLSPLIANYTAPVFSDTEVLLAGTLSAPVQSNNKRLGVASETISGALGARVELGRLTFRPEFNYGYGTLENTQTFVRIQSIANVAASFDFCDADVPSLALPATLDRLNPALFRYSNGFDSLFKVQPTEAAGRLDFSYALDAGVFQSIDFGAKYTELNSRRRSLFSQVGIPAPPNPAAIPITCRSTDLYAPIDNSGLLGGQAPFVTPYLAAEPFGTGAPFACVAIGTPCTPRTFEPVQSFSIEAVTKAAYLKVNFGGDVFGRFRATSACATRRPSASRAARSACCGPANPPSSLRSAHDPSSPTGCPAASSSSR